MNPIFGLILKQLPRLLPVVESLLKKPAPQAKLDHGRLAGVEQSVELLARRSDYLERKLKRLATLTVLGILVSLVALVVALAR